ncbi:MAG: 1,2-phenylacetyl-CoA epoxidase subunit PaaE [Bacteroidota bacterium]
MRPTFHALLVSDVRKETDEAVSIAFSIPEELKEKYQFKAGQYLTLRASVNGEDIRRSYSICSGEMEGELRVAIKKVYQGQFSTWANEEIKVGMEVQVMTPMGHFTPTVRGQKRHYVLYAAGSGITPMLSIAKTMMKGEPESEVTLIYGNRHFHGIMFRDEIEDLKDEYLGRLRVFHVLSGEPNDISLFHGRIDDEKIEGFTKQFIPIDSVNEVFVCGPEPMIMAVKEFYKGKGLLDENIHFELFGTPGSNKTEMKEIKKVVNNEGLSDVTVIFDGNYTQFKMPKSGEMILDAAQKAGLDIPFSCKGGMCCTCRAHIREGAVDMKVNYALEPGEVESGFVLTCQSIPTSDRVVVDFDKV